MGLQGQQVQGHEHISPDDPSRFSRFKVLPAEIRDLIWDRAIPDDQPEVHIVRAHAIRRHAVPTVDIAFPAVMHACREARASCLRHLRMRLCPGRAGIMVPCRDFRLDMDVMYIKVFHFYAFISQSEFFYGELIRKLEHIAVDIALATSANRIAEALQYLDSLETISIVFGQPGKRHEAGQILPEQSGAARRCRLRSLTAKECEETLVDDHPRGRNPQHVGQYLAHARCEVELFTRELLPSLGEAVVIGTWDYSSGRLKAGVKMLGSTVEEYCDGVWMNREARQCIF